MEITMSSRTVPDLKGLIKQASEIAQQDPENLQEAAFNKAFDLLTGNAPLDPAAAHTPLEPKGKKKMSTKTAPKVEESTDKLLSTINSTDHPGVMSATKVLDQALLVLQIAFKDHGVDGLTASQVVKILKDKFRISTTVPAARMALKRATTLVDRVRDGQSFLYKIMAPGETYLAHLGETKDSPIPKTKKKTSNKRTAKKASSSKPNDIPPKSKKKTVTTGTGSLAILTKLIEGNFFSTPKTINDIIKHCDAALARKFKANEFSGRLARMTRSGKLTRKKNRDKQYEYTKA